MIGTFGLAGAAAHQTIAGVMASRDAATAKSRTMALKQYVRVLEANLAKTMMICETLWEIISEKHNLTEEDLHRKLYEIDMRDGVLDGKNQRKAVKCSKCGHTVSPRHPACIYCGNIIDTSVFTIS